MTYKISCVLVGMCESGEKSYLEALIKIEVAKVSLEAKLQKTYGVCVLQRLSKQGSVDLRLSLSKAD